MAKDRRKKGSKGPAGAAPDAPTKPANLTAPGASPEEPEEPEEHEERDGEQDPSAAGAWSALPGDKAAAAARTTAPGAPDAPTIPPQPTPRRGSPMDPGSSGSIEVLFSDPRLPRADDVKDALGEATDVSRAPTTEASLAAHGPLERAGEDDVDPYALEPEPEHAKSSARIVAKKAEVLIGHGVSKIGDGIGSIGEGVTKIGDRTMRVPVLGESVKQIGEGLSELGASLHNLPAVTQSRRGRVLVRSMLVAFLLVFAWIAGIVLLQLRDSKKPDFRPLARKILIAIRDGREAAVWADASPRFQEVVREQRFIDDMADMKRTLGAFKEISAVNDTMVTTGSSGRIGRVALMLQFDKGRARANVSFHRDAGRWKLLGIAVDAPPELPITQESRKERSEIPEEVVAAAIKILQAGNVDLTNIGDGRVPGPRDQGREPGRDRDRNGQRPAPAASPEADRDHRSEEVWRQASEVFHSSASQSEFVRLQRERHQRLGNFVRVIEHKSGSKKYGDLSATFTGLVEYENGVVSAAVNFGRVEERSPWVLNSFKVVLPMPRPDEAPMEGDRGDDDEDDGTERPRTRRGGNGSAGGATPPRGAQGGSASAPATTPAPAATPDGGTGSFTPPPYPPPSAEPATPAPASDAGGP